MKRSEIFDLASYGRTQTLGATATTLQWLGKIVAAASHLSPGQHQVVSVHCRRRPQRKPCTGSLQVERRRDGDEITWTCSGCNDHGNIVNWQRTCWDQRKGDSATSIVSIDDARTRRDTRLQPSHRLYQLTVDVVGGPVPIPDPVRCRLQIHGSTTLEALALAIEQAFDRAADGLYEFMFGAPYDPMVRRYIGGFELEDNADSNHDKIQHTCPEQDLDDPKLDPRLITIDQLNLTEHQAFGYLFDNLYEWVHRITVSAIAETTEPLSGLLVIDQVGELPVLPDWHEDACVACMEEDEASVYPLTDLYGPYSADNEIHPREWLDLEELEGLLWVMEAHAQTLPPDHPPIQFLTLHAVVHTLAETQLALSDNDFQARMNHLLKGGLSRHEAIHRLGEQLVRIMLHEPPSSRPSQHRAGTTKHPKNLQN